MCFTVDEARIILTDLRTIPGKDSIIEYQGLQIINLSSQVEVCDEQLVISREQTDLWARKVKRSKWKIVLTGVGAVVLGFLLGGL